MEAPLEVRMGDRTHGATLAECKQWASEVIDLKAEIKRLRKIEDVAKNIDMNDLLGVLGGE